MESWIDISSGAVGIVTALGMGTVFLCLGLLYFITRLLGSVMLAAQRRASRAATSTSGQTSDAVANESDSSQAAASSADAAADQQRIVAAITLALSRHRTARTRSAAADSGGADAWKIAGRIRMLRSG